MDALPDLTAHRLAPESRAATGTNGRPIRNLRAHPLPIGGDGTGRFGSEAGDSAPEMLDDRNPLNCRVLSLSDGARREEAPPGFEPGVEVLQTSASRRASPSAGTGSPSINNLVALPLPYEAPNLPPDLAAVVDAWPNLPEPIRAGIVAMIQAASGGTGRRAGGETG